MYVRNVTLQTMLKTKYLVYLYKQTITMTCQSTNNLGKLQPAMRLYSNDRYRHLWFGFFGPILRRLQLPSNELGSCNVTSTIYKIS
jgi:hypothetical protein